MTMPSVGVQILAIVGFVSPLASLALRIIVVETLMRDRKLYASLDCPRPFQFGDITLPFRAFPLRWRYGDQERRFITGYLVSWCLGVVTLVLIVILRVVPAS